MKLQLQYKLKPTAFVLNYNTRVCILLLLLYSCTKYTIALGYDDMMKVGKTNTYIHACMYYTHEFLMYIQILCVSILDVLYRR